MSLSAASVRVASRGVVAAGCGDAGVAVELEDSDGEVTRAAMAGGPLPVRIWEASSPSVTSWMWWRASMPQWPRIHPASWAGVASLAARLVTA